MIPTIIKLITSILFNFTLFVIFYFQQWHSFGFMLINGPLYCWLKWNHFQGSKEYNFWKKKKIRFIQQKKQKKKIYLYYYFSQLYYVLMMEIWVYCPPTLLVNIHKNDNNVKHVIVMIFLYTTLHTYVISILWWYPLHVTLQWY